MKQGGISEKLSNPLKLVAKFKQQYAICFCSIRATGLTKFSLNNQVRKNQVSGGESGGFNTPRPCFAGLEKSDINVEALFNFALDPKSNSAPPPFLRGKNDNM